MPRKTMRMSEIRALTNRYLAGSDPELVEFRRGVASMYEHLAMAAGQYFGYNDLVQVWAGEPGQAPYVEDTACRRQYFGPMSGPDAQPAEDFIRTYRASIGDPELTCRQREASNIRLERTAREIADSITEAARNSGTDPIAWVTGNSYMPPLRSFPAAEAVWQADDDGEDFAYLTELVEARLSEASVALECPEHDNALYAVDLRRFEYDEDPDGETLQADWKPLPGYGPESVQTDDEHPTEVPEGIAPEPMTDLDALIDEDATRAKGVKPIDQALYDRTAPAWTCITDPGMGPHYTPHGDCLWCGATAAQIRGAASQPRCCPDCEGDHA